MKLVINSITGNLTVIRYGKLNGSIFAETSVFMPAKDGVDIPGADRNKWWWASTSAPLADVDNVVDGNYLLAPLLDGVELLSEEDLIAETILLDPTPTVLSHFQKVLDDNKAGLDLIAAVVSGKDT